ncbi:MAG: bifunctional DNA primase/polymerase, partial [Actinomycetota bacterium]
MRDGQRPIDAALAYAAAGLPVFPVHERGKTPMTPYGHLDATCDRGRIIQYWQLCPTANIGLAVPRGLVVVDIDDRDALLRLKAEDRDLPATAKTTTGRGLHLYYRAAEEIRNSVGLFPGVDLRGQGGYVVVPPSVHPTGAQYRWEVPLSPANLAEAPDWLLEAAARKQVHRARPPEEWRE